MAVKPIVETNWATDGGALKLEPTSVQKTKGWDTDDETTSGVPEKPTLQHQNGWQNNVHQWLNYFEELSEEVPTIYRLGHTSVRHWSAETGANGGRWTWGAWSPELGIFCIVGKVSTETYNVATSYDGLIWTFATVLTSAELNTVVWSPELSLFVASWGIFTGSKQATSVDGLVWVEATTSADIGGSETRAMIWNPDRSEFVIGSQDGKLGISSDGDVWVVHDPANMNSLTALAWSPELAIYVGYGQWDGGAKFVATSPDGITWTTRDAGSFGTAESVTWSSTLGLFVAVSSNSGNEINTSPDGITWTSTSQGLSTNHTLRSVIWAEQIGQFLAVGTTTAVGSGPGLLTSEDGFKWTERPSPYAADWTNCVYSPKLNLFLAVNFLETGSKNTMNSL